MSGKTRGVWSAVWKNFVDSLKPRKSTGLLAGDDYNGNKYYEVPADPSRGKRYPKRWFVPPVDMQFDQEKIPAEWTAWLRNSRESAPSEDEIKGNLALAAVKKEKGDKIAIRDGTKSATGEPETHASERSFPIYDDFEHTPGDGDQKK